MKYKIDRQVTRIVVTVDANGRKAGCVLPKSTSPDLADDNLIALAAPGLRAMLGEADA